VTWHQRELTLEDILSDPITKEVMKADSVDPHQLSAMLKETARTWSCCSCPSSMCLPTWASAWVNNERPKKASA